MNIRIRNFLDRAGKSPRALLRLLRHYRKRVTIVLLVVFHVLGALSSVEAVMESRTSQGAIAWAISLNTFPYIAVPAYWLFGHSEFTGYMLARQANVAGTRPVVKRISAALDQHNLRVEADAPLSRELGKLAGMPFTGGNRAELLVDGDAIFASIFAAIEAAEQYVLVQFYIVRADGLGRELQARLIAKARAGVKVYFLCDRVGSMDLPESYLEELRAAGAQAQKFTSSQSPLKRLQINFRNHRKIVVVDGKIGFTGGANVGDEYLGKSSDPKMAPWRDTFMKVQGPVVQFLQVPFAEDWFWNTEELLTNLNWNPAAADGGGAQALCLPSGPADTFDTCAMFFLSAINSAQKRLWIATPYFVPDAQIVSALQLAALRGVDVRILIPENLDSSMIYYSSFTYLPEVAKAGIAVYRYQPGFFHEKAILVDDDFAGIGTANFDNRSFRLNFEVTLAVRDAAFASEVARMFETDFAASTLANPADLEDASFVFRLTARVCRLMAPIQ